MENIKKSEQEVLVNNKLKEGKEFQVAKSEVQRDIDYINKLKKEISEKKAETNRLESERRAINEKFKKEFDKLAKAKDRETKPLKETTKYPTTLHLNRIMFCLEDNTSGVCQKEIAKFCCTTSEYIKEGLRFLKKYGLIKEEQRRTKGQYFIYYSLNISNNQLNQEGKDLKQNGSNEKD